MSIGIGGPGTPGGGIDYPDSDPIGSPVGEPIGIGGPGTPGGGINYPPPPPQSPGGDSPGTSLGTYWYVDPVTGQAQQYALTLGDVQALVGSWFSLAYFETNFRSPGAFLDWLNRQWQNSNRGGFFVDDPSDYIVDPDAPTGGGGGGRAPAPTYASPDENVVRETVKALLAAMVGAVDPTRVDQLTELYMEKARQAFKKRSTQQIDPVAAIKAKIRTYSDYKALHQLRDEAVDEMTWISSRQGALVNAGLDSNQALALGRTAAQVDATANQTRGLGETSELRRTGRGIPSLIQNFRAAGNAAVRLLR